MGVTLEFLDDAGAFLAAAGGLLAASPVEATVVATVAERLVKEAAAGRPRPDGFPLWWLVVRGDSGAVVGAGMRVAAFDPHPAFLLTMPAEAARALARVLHERGDLVRGVNGALPAVEVFAAETVRLGGGSCRVAEHTRLHELARLHEPPVPPGRPRPAAEDEVDQVLAWYRAFGAEAARQAGRSGAHAGADLGRDEILSRLRDGQVWVWADDSGAPVHLTGVSAPAYGVSRIGPVFTPAAQRGRGYAGATVAAVSRRLVAEGVRVCLFTDQANPVSNALYERLGFVPVVDMANLVIER
jgi:plasmid stabilization system protein ParE